MGFKKQPYTHLYIKQRITKTIQVISKLHEKTYSCSTLTTVDFAPQLRESIIRMQGLEIHNKKKQTTMLSMFKIKRRRESTILKLKRYVIDRQQTSVILTVWKKHDSF